MKENTRENAGGLVNILKDLLVPGSLIRSSIKEDYYKTGMGLVTGLGFEVVKLGVLGLTAYSAYQVIIS